MIRPIRKVLIANRGEIARRVQRTCRAMGITTVAIWADPDRDAPFVREADEAVHIGSPMATGSFLAIERLVDVARDAGADAVHPGYGFLAENADFAAACVAAGLIFVGPPEDVIRRMGSKIEAKAIMQAAGVPVIPGFTAAGLDAAAIAARAAEIGFPVLVKASAGGGGKGMRIVREATALPDALAAARREAASAFGDDALLVERYVTSPRHVEVQLLGDAHGHLVHCFERECSIQRRHQKIVEEAPSPTIDAPLRARLCDAAVAAGRAIGYQSAGTVEFVVDAEGHFYFLEVNTRLQVEHPVTEAITGLDLVRLQLEVAAGRSPAAPAGRSLGARFCDRGPAVRRGPAPRLPAVDGHARRLRRGARRGRALGERRRDRLVGDDPLRSDARQGDRPRTDARRGDRAARPRAPRHARLRRAHEPRPPDRDPRAPGLSRRTPLDALPRRALDARPRADRRRGRGGSRPRGRGRAVAAGARGAPRHRSSRHLPSGWRNNPSQANGSHSRSTTARSRSAIAVRRDDVQLTVDGVARGAVVFATDADGIALGLDGVRRTCHVVADDDVIWVQSPLGATELREVPRFPVRAPVEVHGGCRAPMPGKVLQVRVAAGDRVARGDTLVILEAMKMEHAVTAPHDGTVAEVRAEPGQQVEAGAILVVLDEETPA